MQMTIRSSVIGASPRPEIRGTERRGADVRSSVNAANDNLNDELIGQTRRVWQPRLGRNLSRDEAKQVAASVTGLARRRDRRYRLARGQ